MIIFDGNQQSAHILKLLNQDIRDKNLRPHLAILLVGDDPASKMYVDKKVKAGEEIGAEVEVLTFPDSVQEGELTRQIRSLNEDRHVQGIMVQLPLPKGLDKSKVLPAIDPKKDVDGLTKASDFAPATALAVLEILSLGKIPLKGKHTVVVGSSDLVGKPVANLLLEQGCSVTVTNEHTVDLGYFTQQADIVVSAVGKKHLITADMVKNGVSIVDVGVSKDKDNKIWGDVDFEQVSQKASFITPVPGGVGPMTVGLLFSNLLKASQK